MASVATAVVGPSAAQVGPASGDWPTLLREVGVAEAIHERAIAVLDRAERRFLALPKSLRKTHPPSWYQVAHDAEAAAGEAKEATCLKVAATPASTRAGQALKLRLIAQAYGMSLDDPPLRSSEADDLVAVLIRSLANDLGADDHHLRS